MVKSVAGTSSVAPTSAASCATNRGIAKMPGKRVSKLVARPRKFVVTHVKRPVMLRMLVERISLVPTSFSSLASVKT